MLIGVVVVIVIVVAVARFVVIIAERRSSLLFFFGCSPQLEGGRLLLQKITTRHADHNR